MVGSDAEKDVLSLKNGCEDEGCRVPSTVVGGGITGLFARFELCNKFGYNYVPLAEPEMIGCGDTRHAQCILHRGYSYTHANNVTIIRELDDAYRWWVGFLKMHDVPHAVGISHYFGRVGFRKQWYRSWKLCVDDNNENILEEPKDVDVDPAPWADLVRTGPGEFLEGGGFHVEEILVRPSHILKVLNKSFGGVDYIVKAETSDIQQSHNALGVRARSRVSAVGRRHYEEKSESEVPAKRLWNLVVAGELPQINAVFHGLRLQPIDDSCGPKLTSTEVTVLSHQEGDRMIWLIQSHAFEAAYRAEPSIHRLRIQGVNAVKQALCFAIKSVSFKDCKWGAYSAKLPSLESRTGALKDRNVHNVGRDYYGYSERLTLAPLVGQEIASRVWNASSQKTGFCQDSKGACSLKSRTSSQVKFAEDQWKEHLDKLTDWDEFEQLFKI